MIPRTQEFLDELTALSHAYGIYIDSGDAVWLRVVKPGQEGRRYTCDSAGEWLEFTPSEEERRRENEERQRFIEELTAELEERLAESAPIPEYLDRKRREALAACREKKNRAAQPR